MKNLTTLKLIACALAICALQSTNIRHAVSTSRTIAYNGQDQGCVPDPHKGKGRA